jgi:hypothetical protein
VSEREEILDAIDRGMEHYTPSVPGVFVELQNLFAERPWLASVLLPEYCVVGRWGNFHMYEVGPPLAREA